MARLPRLLIPGHLHLLIQRSVGGVSIFQTAADAELYMAPLRELGREHQVLIHAYALLPTQVLFLLTPGHENSLSRLMQAQGRRFGAAYNRAHQRSGVLWEGRFRATVVDPASHGLPSLQFVETAALRAGLCQVAADYPWSSAAHHAGRLNDALITEHAFHWSLGNTPFEREAIYRDRLQQLQPDAVWRPIEDAALKGWVLGSPDFVRSLGEVTDRRLTSQPKGRPAHKSKPTKP